MVKKSKTEESASTSNHKNDEKPFFMEGLANEDLSKLPCLEMQIHHEGTSHSPQKSTDEITYKYKSSGDGVDITIDPDEIDETSSSEDEDDVTYEDQDKTVSVKKSLIDNYRKKSNYYGPLRIISEKIKVTDKGVAREAIQAKLQHVEIQATDNDGNAVDDHELQILMSQTPGIIPACDPPTQTNKKDKGFMCLDLGNGEKYKVSKKALSSFQKQANVSPPFNTKIQKIFTTDSGTTIPITLVTLYPRTDKVTYQSELQEEKKSPLKKLVARKSRSGKPKLVNFYRQNYINWAHRGNICFSEIKKIGMDFVEEILVDKLIVQDSLKVLGCSLSTTAQNLEPIEAAEDNSSESQVQNMSKEFVEEIWNHLINIVRTDNFLIEFEFEMDDEKWLEIKRAFNMFQVSGEVVPDIVLKVVLKKKEDAYKLTYYLRCIGRLVKSGAVQSKSDIDDLLRCLAKDKYICIGFSKENFLLQADQNETLRIHLKENCFLTTIPFESLYSKKCKAIVRDADSIENTKIYRGSFIALGPSVICQPCDALQKKLKDLVDPSINFYAPQEVSQRYIRQRYGPLHTINVSENIKNLFTQTPMEFVQGVKRKLAHNKIAENEDSVIKQIKSVDENADIFKCDKPSIKVNEEEFSKMLFVKKYSKSSSALRKECEVCGFQAKTMLALFVHLNDHLGSLNEECKECNMKVSSKEALYNHKSLCVHSRKNLTCTECHNIFPSNEKLFEHMNEHRKVRPFSCSYCEISLQSMNEYKKHLKRSHQVNTVKELNFCCSFCQAYFYTNDHLLIHKVNQNHCGKAHLTCKICNFSCGIPSAFQSHILTHSYEERENSNLAICQECKKIFFSSFKLEDHIKKKHNISITVDAKSVEVPTAHEQVSISSQPSFESYPCSKCFKSYHSLNALQKHIEIFHPEKVEASPSNFMETFICNNCGRKFNSEYFLNSHMKLHQGNKSVFQCEECGFVYGKRPQVLDHIRNDHAEQVEKHQQLQQQTQETEIISETQIFESQQQAYTEGQVITIENQGQVVQQAQNDTWNQLKIPNVETTQEVSYNFPNFNAQFF